MQRLVSQFTNQLTEALEIGKSANLKAAKSPISNMVITGLGGSGIGGLIATQLASDQLNIPVSINNDYTLPVFVSENTLVIVSSFSGNTEETLEALRAAQDKNAEIACITSGGKLTEIAMEKGYNLITLPEAFSPRAMLTYSVVQQLFMFHHYGLINNYFVEEVKETVKLLESEEASIKDLAHQISLMLHTRTTIAYSDSSMEGVITRFRQQINENSKCLGWQHVVPEMNHNELVGWAGGKEEYAVVIFRSDYEHPRSSVRLNISKEIIEKKTSSVVECHAKGNSLIAQSFYHILLGDWISVYLADLNKVDSVEVKVINYLKAELAKI